MTCLQSERNKHDRIDTRALNERAPQVSARDVIEESSQRILVSNCHTRGTEEDVLTLLKRSMLCNASRITPRPPTTSHFFFGPWSDRLLEPIRTRSTSVPVFECIVEVLVAVLNLARHCCFIFFSLYMAEYNALLLEKLSLSPYINIYIYTLSLCQEHNSLNANTAQRSLARIETELRTEIRTVRGQLLVCEGNLLSCFWSQRERARKKVEDVDDGSMDEGACEIF